MKTLNIKTDQSRQVLNITSKVSQQLPKQDGVVHLFITHTTAAITTADLDPGTDQDYLKVFNNLIPQLDFNHPHDPDHFPDHFLASLVGPSLTVPVKNGQLQLGTWQEIVLLEFSGPRERIVMVEFIPSQTESWH